MGSGLTARMIMETMTRDTTEKMRYSLSRCARVNVGPAVTWLVGP